MKIAAKDMRSEFASQQEVAIANQGLFNFLERLIKFKIYEQDKIDINGNSTDLQNHQNYE